MPKKFMLVVSIAGATMMAMPASAQTLEECLISKGCMGQNGAWLCPNQEDYSDCLLGVGALVNG